MAAGERPVEAEESLGPKALATEAVMLGLRTTAGIDLDGFTARYGIDLLAVNEALVTRLLAEGHLVVHADAEGGRRLAPTVPDWRSPTAWPPRSTSRFSAEPRIPSGRWRAAQLRRVRPSAALGPVDNVYTRCIVIV